MKKHTWIFCIAAFLCIQSAHAMGAGDYRTTTSGNWNNTAIWQTFDGSKWLPAIAPPDSTAGVITISTGDSIVVTDTTFADQLVVAGGAILHILKNEFFLHNGAGSDMKVLGKLEVDGIARVGDAPGGFGATVQYQGDTLIQSGGLQAILTFNGRHPQTIFGNGFGSNVIIDNAANVTIVGSQSYGKITFQNGKLIVPGIVIMSEFGNTFIGANSTRYLEGNIGIVVFSNNSLSLKLPIGSAGHYLPVVFTIQKSNPQQTLYTLGIKNGPPAAAALPSTLDRVSAVRFITITTDHPEGVAKAALRMSYDSSDHVTDPTRLRIAQRIGSNWVNLGGTGSGNSAGAVTATSFTTVGDLVLADAFNAPVLSLDRSITSGNITLPDIYKLTTNGDGNVRLNLTATNSAGVSAILLDGDSATVLGNISVAGNSTGSLEQDGLAKGSYYVRLSPNTAAQPYTYTLADSLFKPAQAADKEPNGTILLAQTLTVNNIATGHIGYYYKNLRDTIDFYKIKTSSTGRLQLTIASANNNAVSLTLFNSTGITVLNSVTAPGNTIAALQQPGLPKGTYYLGVTAANRSQFAPYIVSDSLFVPSFTTGTEAENMSAVAIEGKGRSIDVSIYPNPAPQQFRINISGMEGFTGTVALTLQDETGKTVWSNAEVNASSLNSVSVDVSKLPAGVYFLHLTDGGKNSVTKKIIVSR